MPEEEETSLPPPQSTAGQNKSSALRESKGRAGIGTLVPEEALTLPTGHTGHAGLLQMSSPKAQAHEDGA